MKGRLMTGKELKSKISLQTPFSNVPTLYIDAINDKNTYKVKISESGEIIDYMIAYKKYGYCPYCGQKLDWSEENED